MFIHRITNCSQQIQITLFSLLYPRSIDCDICQLICVYVSLSLYSTATNPHRRVVGPAAFSYPATIRYLKESG